jgi:hypothetical protein
MFKLPSSSSLSLRRSKIPLAVGIARKPDILLIVTSYGLSLVFHLLLFSGSKNYSVSSDSLSYELTLSSTQAESSKNLLVQPIN